MSNEEKEIKLELNSKTLKRIDDAFEAMKEEFTRRVPKNPAEDLIRQRITVIDEMAKLGAKIPQIYERLNKAVPLGISVGSFAVYVRRIRKETGSEFYTPRKAKKEEVQREQKTNLIAMQTETISADVWSCERCEAEAERRESTKQPGTHFWKCPSCNAFYKDKNGELTNEKLGA